MTEKETTARPAGVALEEGRVATDDELERAVSAGARLLDHERPGWAGELNLDCLALEDLAHCVLGQLYGGFSRGVDELGIDGGPAPSYGFDVPGVAYQALEVGDVAFSVSRHQYEVLDEEWSREVTARRYRQHFLEPRRRALDVRTTEKEVYHGA